MPSFSDIADRVVVAGFDGTGQYSNDSINALFAQAYEGSTSLAAQVTLWLNNPSNIGKNITITYVPRSDPNSPGYAFSGAGEIFITPDRCDDLLYISENGNAVQHSVLSVLVHEIGHAITGVRDDPTYSNLKGGNISQYVNNWYGELSIPKEAGYLSRAFAETSILAVDKEYTEGIHIENAIVDLGGQPVGIAVDVVNPDFLGNGVTGPVLFVGSYLDNDVRGTDSADYLYGAGGADFLIGAGGADKLYGEADEDYIEGGDDDDTIMGGVGNDQLFGDEGADTIHAGADADIVEGGVGDDVIYGEGGNDDIAAGPQQSASNSDNDTVWAGAGNDKITGGSGNDSLHGDDGNDTIHGDTGADKLYGGDSEDTLYADADDAVIDGGSGYDTANYFQSDKPVNWEAISAQISGIELVIGSDFGDTLALPSNLLFPDDATEVRGGKGNDRLTGNDASNVLDGGDDNDNIWGGSDNDILAGGAGDDRIEGGDSFYITASDKDRIFGGAGNDTIDGGADDDQIWGEDGDDKILGGRGRDVINGGSGNDILVGGQDVDTIQGGSGNDILDAAQQDGPSGNPVDNASPDELWGGAGADTFLTNNGDVIHDIDGGDRVKLDGTLLAGGESKTPPRNPCTPSQNGDEPDDGKYTAANGTIYELAGSTLTVTSPPGLLGTLFSSTITIENFRNGDGGIRLNEARPNQDQAECNKDPLIIDLDGDRNVVRELFDSTAYFDLDNDGFRERVAWSLSGDGFLVRDRNGNGQIDDGTELFGSGRTEFDGGVTAKKGTSGFAELTTLDSNFDGAINALDTDFAALRAWVDANGDAVTDEGELKSLDELGIVSISLKTLVSNDLDCGCDGTEVTYRSNVTFADGSSRSMYDAYLAIDQYDTREIVADIQIPADFEDLPFLIGSGTLSDLDVAMARDPALEEMVRAFVALTPDQADEIGERAEQILLRWTGADTIAADSRGTAINARWLRAIEVVSGSNYNQSNIGADPRADGATILITEWNRLVGDITAKLLGQTTLGQTLLPGLSYAGAAFYTAEDGTSLQAVLSQALLSAPIGDSEKLNYWHTIAASLLRYEGALGTDRTDILAALDPILLQQGVGLTANQLTEALFATASGAGSAVDSTIPKFRGQSFLTDRTLIATGGSVLLNGGAGNDRYIVTGEVSSATITDLDGTDLLELRGWEHMQTEAATKVLRSKFDAVAGTMTASFELTLSQGDSNALVNVDFRNGKFFAGADYVTFDDGSFDIIDLLDFNNEIVRGGTGATYSFADANVNQVLIGRSAADVYQLSATSGTDIIFEAGSQPSLGDVLHIDALHSEVSFASTGADLSNLTVGIIGSGSTVTINGQFGSSGQAVDIFEFSDGSRIMAVDVHAGLTRGTSGSDKLHGTAAGDLFDGMGGADTLAGGAGEDVYIFRPGYGQLIIDDLNGENYIRIEGGISEADLDYSPQPDGLRISVGTSGDAIVLKGDPYAENTSIELNGTAVSIVSLLVRRAQQAGTLVNGRIDGTAGDDSLTGSSDADLIVGNGGNDFAQGGLGNDTFLVTSGKVRVSDTGFGYDRILIGSTFSLSDFEFVTAPYGDIRIRLGGTALRVDMPNQLNYTTGLAEAGGSDIEEIAFADGYTIDLTAGRILTGDAGNNVLFNYGYGATTFTPGAGDDYIFSLNGSHALQLSAGFGHDVFYSSAQGNITFSGISLDAHVSFARDGFDLVVKVADGADTLTLKNAFEPLGGFWNRTLYFAGSQITVQQVVNSIAVATIGDDLLWGRTTLDGGAGIDVLIGDGSPNSYVFGRGYGNDIIKEQDGIFGNSGSSDVLTLVGLTRSDVTFARDAADPLSLVITIRDTGETLTLDGTPFDSYTYNSEDSLGDGYSTGDQSGAHWIDQIVFADGAVLTQRDIEQAIIDAERTSGTDIFDNFGAPSGSFGGDAGAVLDGGAGDDTYVNQFDDIHVQISAGTGSDRIVNLNPGRTRVHVSLAGIPAADILILYETREGQEVTVLHAKSGEELVIDGRPDGNNDLSIYVRDIAAGTEYIAFAEGALVDGQVATDGVDYLNGEITYQSEGPTIVFDDTFNPGKGDDVIAGLGGADTINFNPGDGSDRLLRSGLSGEFGDAPESYVISLGAGIARQDFTYSWLNDGSYNVLLSFNDQGDGIKVDAREAGTLAFADGSIIQIGDFGSSSISLSPGQTVWFNEATDDIFVAEFGDVRIRIGADSGNDRFIDSSLSGPDGPLLQAPEDWEANALILEGGASLDDFEFVKDSSAPNNLVVRNLLTGSSIVVEDQFASEALVSDQPAWRSPDLNGDGAADWATADLDGDGEIDFAGFDSDGDGSPNWTNPDFNGDGVADWERYTQLSLDTNGDGNPDVYAHDGNSDGTVDTFDVLLTPTASQPNVYGVTFRDINGDNVVDEYTTDYVTFTPLPVDGNGAVAWNTIDTNEDGVGDIAQLDTDGDGAPNWLAPDIDGDGQSDWRDESVDELYNANGDYVGFRVLDPLTGNATYVAEGSGGDIVARDTNGDGEPDEVGIDRNYDQQADPLEAYFPVDEIGLSVENPDGSITTTYSDWSAIAGRVITRNEGTEEESEFSTLDLLADRPAATSGDDVLVVGDGETVDGLGGNDRIYAADGGATIRFGRGSGNDTVFSDRPEASSANTVVFTNIQSPNDIEVLRGAGDSTDLVVRIRDTGEELRIVGQWQPTDNGSTMAMVESFTFANGLQFSHAQMLTLVTGESGTGDGTITSGSDGGLLNGGAGNDTLAGGIGDDIYAFGRGFDEDLIRDAGGVDMVNFADGVTLADLYFSRTGQDGGDLLIEVTGLERLSLTIAGQFLPGSARVENFQFADGRNFTWSDIEAIILDQSQTGGNDTILGFSGDDVLRGLTGSDTISGTWGDDVIDGGAGRDTATYRGAAADYDVVTVNGVTTITDRVAGRDGTDTLSGIEELHFAGGGGSTVLLTSANQLPVAAGTTASGTEDADFVIARASLLALASDGDGDSLQLSVGGASHGKVWIGLDGDIRFRPDADFNGEAEFDYSVADGNGGVATARVTVSVSSVNDAPVVATGFADVAVLEDQPVLVTIPATLFTDVDGDAVTIALHRAGGEPLPDWLSFADGVLSGTPPLDFNGNLDLEISGSDGTLATGIPFTLSVLALNDAPRVVAPIADQTVAVGGTVSIAIPASNFVDPEGDPIDVAVTLASGEALPSWLTYVGGVLQGTLPADQAESIAFAIRASDGRAVTTSQFAINVTSNAAPTIGTALADVSSTEDGQIVIALPADAFTDPDGDALTLTASLVGGTPLPDWLAFDGSQFTGQPPANFSGVLDLTVTASDGTDTASQGFRLTISPVNDAPAQLQPVGDFATPEDQPFNLALPVGTFGDVDGDALTLSAALADGSELPSWLSFDAASGTFSGTPANGDVGSLAISVKVTDPAGASTTASFTLTVTNVNDAPALNGSVESQTIVEDAAFSLVLPETLFADVDVGDTLSVAVTLGDGSALPGWLHFDAATRTLSGTPLNGDVGAIDIKVTATDPAGASASTGFSLTVTNVNDAPVVDLGMTNVSVAEDTAVDFVVPAQAFRDMDGDALALSATLTDGSVLPGWLTFDGNRFSGTPPLNFNDSYAVRLTASDGQAVASTDFTLSITPVNDAPVAGDNTLYNVASGGQATITLADLLANDSDVDGDTLTLAGFSAPGHGTASLDADGSIVYTPTAGYTGADSMTYTISDGQATSTATISITVVNPDPYAGWQQGTAGNDFMFGRLFSANRIYGAAGNDLITGGTVSDSLAGGSGNDIVLGLGGDDILEGNDGTDALSGGSGNDQLTGGAGNDILTGDSGIDTAVFSGLKSSYSIQTFLGVVTIADNAPTVDGNDGTDTLIGVEKAVFKNGEQLALAAPVVLDLDGDGVELLSRTGRGRSQTSFDWDGDGRRDRTGWVGRDDGFLVYDRNGDGTVTEASELSFTNDKDGAKSDLDGLTAFDSNGDGILSAEDKKFSSFHVWRDRNSDGKVGRGEFLTLEQAGIASLTLAGEAVNQNWGWDQNLVINNGTYTRTDGTTRELADVALNYAVPRAAGVTPLVIPDDVLAADEGASSSATIQRNASQLAEAIAGFGVDRGTGDLFGQQSWMDKREALFAASGRFAMR